MTNVEVKTVAKHYGGTPVLTDITCHFAEGSFTSLLGPSGSGKTTLLRIIAGFVAPDHGNVAIGGKDVTHTPVRARNIGMVFQSYALFPHMNVNQNVGFGLARRGIRGSAARDKIARALEMVRLPDFGARSPKQLSGGQRQRVALARAIVTEPTVLLLDEPLSALDRRLRQEMQVELVRIQRESGLTTIFVTHDQEEALSLSDRVAILDRGEIIQSGRPAEVYERPRTRFAAEFLGDSNFMSGTVRDRTIVLEDGQRIATGFDLPSDGEHATVAVRPEKMTIIGGHDPASDGENQLSARVTNVIYAGPALTYTLQGVDGTTLKVFAQNRDGRPRETGETVTLVWKAADTVPIEA
ncbi:ABC transporter ATP-binding protein [Pararhizobium mangrovi]|uniref:ABC transporter ATP-binding protein n=1 Tax=Pararhizobium mangrovi TaxID=2590452 RepID=A0A506U1U4_9HYPH|nr:ABC transporter ATP-binding protein [Pararhizobium mangrovi]TPW25827.1 ABC transporter ATP-binding protein [Pararhizobium mangrovi]